MLLIIRCLIISMFYNNHKEWAFMSKDIKQALGTVLKRIRLEQNISQEKFALKINMDRTYYASVEAGKRNISIENIRKIADGLNVSLADLFSCVENVLVSGD